MSKKVGIKKVMIEINGKFKKVNNKEEEIERFDSWLNNIPTNNDNNKNVLFKVKKMYVDDDILKVQYYDEPIGKKEHTLYRSLLNTFKGVTIETAEYNIDKKIVADLNYNGEKYGKTFFYAYYNKFYNELYEFLISKLLDMEMFKS